jgi:hypothetical protein
MQLNSFLVLIISVLLTSACAISKKASEPCHIEEITPPNGILISENFYCDQSETTNFNWLEYMFWLNKIYGTRSSEYLGANLDTLVWVDEDSCTYKYANYYLRHPAYRDYPVVGVSHQQALNYSKWRSDRVFEYILIQKGIIDLNSAQTKETAFSIEKFFTGKIERIDTLKQVIYYPEFSLPNIAERKEILHYSDSLDSNYIHLYYSDYGQKDDFSLIHCNFEPCPNDSTRMDPTRPVSTYRSRKKIQPIYHLRGNVGEWAKEEGVSFGGSWGDELSHILQNDALQSPNTSKFIGFRNICRYKKWRAE